MRKGAPIRDGKDIRVGDWVQVYRAGDVIPKIADVDLSKRPPDAEPFAFPDACPECGSDAVREEGDSVRRCTGGLICPAQAVEKLKHFVPRRLRHRGAGRQAGRGVPRRRLDRGARRHLQLKARYGSGGLQQLKNREGWGEKSAANLFAAIDERRASRSNRLIFALGIRHVGEVAPPISRAISAWLAGLRRGV
jgi:DNA ligase (NAD+)